MLEDDSDVDISNYFRSNLIATRKAINAANWKKFAALNTGRQRIAFILKQPEPHNLSLEIENPEIKDPEQCALLKEKGNKLFGQGAFEKAAEIYSTAVLVSPRQELAVLLANRSAAFYHLEKYERALSDMDEAANAAYPKELMYKIEERRARCYLALKKYSRADESFKKTLQTLDHAKLSVERKKQVETDTRIMLKVMEKGRQLKKNARSEEKAKKTLPRIKERNPLYPAISKSLEVVDGSADVGRYIMATRDIEPGEILAVEKPHCAVLLKEYRLTHCHFCQTKIEALLPASCYTCSSIAYCSSECRKADEKVHEIECPILGALWCSNASVTCIMALKAVIQRPFEEVMKLQGRLTLNTSEEHPYRGEDYVSFHNLVTHEDERTTDDLFHRAYMSAWLLRLLKTTKYLPEKWKSESKAGVELLEEELFLADLIYHNLQLLQFNSHEISELKRKELSSLASARSIFIGGAVYPTLALFNHSCSPGIIRYFIGTTIVVQSVKTIYKGTEVCDNYGAMFTETPEKERKRKMRLQYWFDCRCEACTEHWPLLEEMNTKILRFKCETGKSCGNALPVKTETSEFMITCKKCGKVTSILKGLKALQEIDSLFEQASKNLEIGNHEKSLKLYLKILKLLDERLALPTRDYTLAQQGVRLCTLALGNLNMS